MYAVAAGKMLSIQKANAANFDASAICKPTDCEYTQAKWTSDSVDSLPSFHHISIAFGGCWGFVC